MPHNENYAESLKEIQELARQLDKKLREEFKDEWFAKGGNLILGKYYARSNRIFLGLNPGGDGKSFNVEKELDNFWDCGDPEYRYWENCKTFVNAAVGLHEWITHATAGFCCPWRTMDQAGLKELNRKTQGRLFEYSGQLLLKLIDHHKENAPRCKVTLVVAGRASLYLISSPPLRNFDWRAHQKSHHGSGIYQWSKTECDDLVIYQVPHFSRMNSAAQLQKCAQWLPQDLASPQCTVPG